MWLVGGINQITVPYDGVKIRSITFNIEENMGT